MCLARPFLAVAEGHGRESGTTGGRGLVGLAGQPWLITALIGCVVFASKLGLALSISVFDCDGGHCHILLVLKIDSCYPQPVIPKREVLGPPLVVSLDNQTPCALVVIGWFVLTSVFRHTPEGRES